MGVQAFSPMGNTVVLTAATTAPTPVQAVASGLGANQYRIVNDSQYTAFIGFATTAAQANTNAQVITTTAFCLPLLGGTDEILTFLPNAYFTAITASNTATIYITPGDGV
jgi:hypothetical protein